jgi:hypothetical protein
MNSFVRRPPRRRPDQRSGGGMRRPSNGGFRTNRPQNIEHSFNNNGIMVIEITDRLMERIS